MVSDRQKNMQLSSLAFKTVKERIPVDVSKDIYDYIHTYNEWGLGIEILIDYLLEEDIHITGSQRNAILAAASAMNIDRGQKALKVHDE